MMAQKLMTDARNTPGSDSPFFPSRIDSAVRQMPDIIDASISPEPTNLGRVAYGAGAMGTLFAPGAGVADIFGGAPDPFRPGEMLPSFGENIGQGNYLDAGLQTLGAAGDVALAAGALFPPALPAAAALGTALKAPRAARVALSPEITRAISRNTDRNAKKVAKDLRQEGLLDVNDRDQSEAFFAEFQRIKNLQSERKAAKPDRIDDLERNKNVRSLKADRLKAQKPIKQSPMFEAWTKPNRERVLNSTYDSATLDAEARLATVEAIAREAKKRGLEVYYTSKGQRGRAGSRYIELPDGGKVRVSDHELPDTSQRQYTRSQGIGNFADEIIVSDWETSSVDDYLNRILKRPDPNQAADAARLSRAKEQGFDVDNPVYHGTSAEKLSEFDEKKIGSATDAGFYGKGIYFASNPGEARYYGPNVGKYVVRGKFLDLKNKTGDYTLGGAKKFIGWATQLDEIGALDDVTKEGLKGAKKLVKYFDENVKFNPGQNPDGTTGVYAQIVDPTRKPQIFKGKEYPETVDLRVDVRGFFAKDEAEAKQRLFDSFAYQMKTSSYKDIDYFKGWNDDFYTSLSDYVRVGPVGSAGLTEKAKAAGYDGIKADDETVVFDPKNIRLLDAEFDSKKTDSPDLLSSRAVDQAVFA